MALPLPRLLAVDDERLIRMALTRTISAVFNVTVASDGDEAERLLLETPFDVIVSDFQMPGRNGLEVLGRAKEIQPRCKRVLLTGNNPELLGDLSICDAVLTKPWDNDALRAALLTLLAPV